MHAARFALAALALAVETAASAETPRVYLDIPISQTIMRDGNIRYGVWVKVGQRSVQAMLDTGSTGLRVLPTVLPGDLVGIPTDIAFGAGMHMQGLATKAPLEIGSLKGEAIVEVIDQIGCVERSPDCDYTHADGDNYRIGGDGFPSDGYSAILGIGFPFRGTDIPNPLDSLGVKRWIIQLPRPYETDAGHLILEPSDEAAKGFSTLTRTARFADGDGCIEGGPLKKKKCGAVLFDTGAPGIILSHEEVTAPSRWDGGATGSLSFRISRDESLTLPFHVGENGTLSAVGMQPPEKNDPARPFILAGAYPYLSYDILYDATAHTVGLRKRTSVTSTDEQMPARPDARAAAPEKTDRHIASD